MNQAFYKIAQESNFTTQNLVADMAQNKKMLASEKGQAEIEQRIFLSALRSKEYLQRITQIGNLQKLNDDAIFKEEAARVSMGHRANMLHRDLNSRMEAMMKEQQAQAQRAEAERKALSDRNQDAMRAAKLRQDLDLADRALTARVQMKSGAERAIRGRESASLRAVEQRKANMDYAIQQANAEVQIANEIMKDTLRKERFAAGSKAIQSTIMAGVAAYDAGMFDSEIGDEKGLNAFLDKSDPNVAAGGRDQTFFEASRTGSENMSSQYKPDPYSWMDLSTKR
jgi:hypothetical protein